jgi:hypothetical protein
MKWHKNIWRLGKLFVRSNIPPACRAIQLTKSVQRMDSFFYITRYADL